MAFNLSMSASDIDKTLVESRQLLDSEPATKQYVDEKATWEALPDKPTIFEGGDTLTWDGNTEGLVSVVDMFYKVADATPTADELIGCKVDFDAGSGRIEADITSDNLTDTEMGVIVLLGGAVFVIFDSGVGVDIGMGFGFPEAGIYFINGNGTTTFSLTIPGYTGFGKEVIDPDYLPDSVKGGASSWNDLTDKPFGEVGGDTLTWDGNTEGLVSVSGAFYKVSDAIPTMDDFANGFGAVMNGSYAEGSADNVGNPVENIIVAGGIYIVSSPGAELDGLVFPETGVYFMHVPGNMEVTSFTINGYTGFPSVKTIDEKFLPESVKGGSGGVVYVTVETNEDGTEITNCSMFFPEIKAAYEAGKAIMAVLPFGDDHTILPLTAVGASSGLVDFSATLVVSGYPYFYYARIGASTSDTSIGLAMLATTTP